MGDLHNPQFVYSIDISQLAESVVTERLEAKGTKSRRDVVQSLIDYRDRDGKSTPRERLNGEIYGLL